MTEYATPSNTTNPVLNPVLYWRVTALLLTAVAIAGVLWNGITQENNVGMGNFLRFDWTHNIVHIVLAGAAFIFGFANLPGRVVKTFAIVFGVVYTGLGILGFIQPVVDGLDDALVLHLEVGENLVHLLIGAWALASGFGARYD